MRSYIVDAAAVVVFAGATALFALRVHEEFARQVTEPPVAYETRVASAVPKLEAFVASGSMRDRSGDSCNAATAGLRELDAVETSIGPAPNDGPSDVAAELENADGALRACLACTPEPHGCAAAARALTKLETRLRVPRWAGGT